MEMDQLRNAEARAETGEFDATSRPNSTQQPIRGVMNVSPKSLTRNNIVVSFDENVTRTAKTPQSIAKDINSMPDARLIDSMITTPSNPQGCWLTIPRPNFSDETSASCSRTPIPFQDISNHVRQPTNSSRSYISISPTSATADSTIPVTNIYALQCHKDKFQNKRPKKQNIRIMPNETLARIQGRVAWNALIVDGDGQNGNLDLNDSSVNNNTSQSVHEMLNEG
ncbi:uncharacterized protein G2W53_010274 [Senna tora]|uniref:Uncharacterized protein n=1 Tax=Senna tora TaxID=362788 RepID=A0A834WYZ8_9FABA|nr:uncharacterized protein G2W53_010274 [Senna tora]